MANITGEMPIGYFTFIWAVESNFGLLTPLRIISPEFTVVFTQSTSWCLEIDVEGDFFMCFLRRLYDEVSSTVVIDFDIALLDSEGHPLILRRLKHDFKEGQAFEDRIFASVDDVFNLRRSQFVSNNTFTLRCRISQMISKEFKFDLCYARTRLAIESNSFIWVVTDFSTKLEWEGPRFVLNENKVVKLKLQIIKEGGYEIVNVGVFSCFPIRFMCLISVLDIAGGVFARVMHRCCLNNSSMRFCVLGREMLMDKKAACLPLDTLTLRCEFIIGTGVAWSRIEHVRNYCDKVKKEID
ncbi:uncharacterized protein NPIL_679731 [Nephila pilipes]|uniref:Uncharacterized protein n=1 Tax=Nephila pilipes TaxID=299642 RepID=A0A8X6PHS2_NEPPI|nr:uncharacterized protein NPIL_679731 [Nephila pilipes]